VHLADRGQIGALSHFARQDQSSTIAEAARSLPFTYETAEEIIDKSPDLVLASKHSGRATRQTLERMGIPVQTFVVPNSVAESLEMIRAVAKAIGQVERGETLVADIARAIEAARPRQIQRPIKTIVFQPRGLVAGRGTLVDDMLQRTGFENVAARYGVEKWGSVSLERLIADPPELLLAPAPVTGAQTRAERVVSHPALSSIASLMKRHAFPEACLYCGGPVLLTTAPVLAKAREAYWSAR
jgi:iron complex transport system substrate-binding protein